MPVGVLLMSLSSGASCFYFDREGNGDGAAFSDHIPSGVHILACLNTSHGVGSCG